MLRTFLFRFHSWRADRAYTKATAYLKRPSRAGWDAVTQLCLEHRAARLSAVARRYV